MIKLERFLALGAIGAVAGLGAVRLDDVSRRLTEADALARREPASLSLLREDVAAVRAEIERARTDIRTARATGERGEAAANDLASRLEQAEASLAQLDGTLDSHTTQIGTLSSRGADVGAIEARFDQLDVEVATSLEGVRTAAATAAEIADANRRRLEDLGAQLEKRRDLESMWRRLVGPVVQLAGDTSVGSGVLLESQPAGPGGEFVTYLLTAWHVVRDIQGNLDRRNEPVPVTVYELDGTTRDESALLLEYDPDLDAAILQLRTTRRMPHGARLAKRGRIDDVRIFQDIYAVGCPLGNDPIPTPGEVSSTAHRVDGESYWMINAPTFIGNSGGGIFDADSFELIGLFSKIYNYGSLRPTIVPHMGLATPMDRVYDWLDAVGYSVEEPAAADPFIAVASSKP